VNLDAAPAQGQRHPALTYPKLEHRSRPGVVSEEVNRPTERLGVEQAR
jgi:hypothetical protein